MENNPLLRREAAERNVIITFSSLDEAVRFLKDFWNAVDSEGVGKRVANHSLENFIGERTHGKDRAILQDVGDGKYALHIYGNNDANQLSEKASAFLKSHVP